MTTGIDLQKYDSTVDENQIVRVMQYDTSGDSTTSFYVGVHDSFTSATEQVERIAFMLELDWVAESEESICAIAEDHEFSLMVEEIQTA